MTGLSQKRRRDIAGHKWQYGAVGLTIFLGVMAYATTYDAYRNLGTSYRRTYEDLHLADVTVTGTDERLAPDVLALASVQTVEWRLQADLPLRFPGGHTLMGRLVGMPPGTEPQLDQLDVTEGRYLPADGTDSAVVETHAFDSFDLALGDEIEYFAGGAWHSLRVVGRAISAEYLWPAPSSQDVLSPPDSFGVAFVDQRLLATLGAGTESQLLVGYRAGAVRQIVDAAVRRTAGRDRATSVVVQADQPSNKALQLDVTGFEQMAYAFPALFLLAAGMAAYTLLTRLVFQEREVIGTLRANGLSRDAVVRHYLSYGLALGSVAGVLGLAAGLPLGWLATKEYTSQLGIPESVRSLHATTLVVGLAFGLVTGVLAAWVPARYAARLDPAQAMRGAMATAGADRSLLLRLPLVSRLPTRWRMVVRGIGRNKRRSLSTVLGVVLALDLILASWALSDSTRWLLNDQFEHIELQDAVMALGTRVDAAALGELAGVGGVQTVERVVSVDVSVDSQGHTYGTRLMAFPPDTKMHGFGSSAPTHGVVLGSGIRKVMPLEVGDNVTLALTSLGTSIQVPVTAFVEEPLGTIAYMRPDVLEAWLGTARPPVLPDRLELPDAAVAMARFNPEADATQVIDQIRQLPGVVSVTDSRELYRLVQRYMGLFYVFVGLMIAFGGALAFALIFNTMSVNMAERATEMATMRANGLSRSQAARLVVGENLLLTVVGIPFGLVTGRWIAEAMMATYDSDIMAFPAHIASMTYVWCAVAMVLVALGSIWPGVRAAGNVDIGSIVRQRSA